MAFVEGKLWEHYICIFEIPGRRFSGDCSSTTKGMSHGCIAAKINRLQFDVGRLVCHHVLFIGQSYIIHQRCVDERPRVDMTCDMGILDKVHQDEMNQRPT